MPAVLWIATILMTMLALSFVLKPLAGAKRQGVTIVLAIAVPAFAASVYFGLGSPSVASASGHPATSEATASTAAPHEQTTAGSIASLADGLAARLENDPDDGKGWLLLAKSYQHLNRIDDARDAYARATALGESDAALEQLFAGNVFGSVNTPVAQAGPAVTGSVDLSPALRELVKPTDLIFIFARAPGQTGAPLAVITTSASSWPIEFRLTDGQSMVDGVRLSNHNEVIVTARLSRGANTENALKGLEAKSPPIAVASGKPVHLIIEKPEEANKL